MGLDGKILVMFRSMYTVVKSSVKHCNSFSDFFSISVGLRQGLNNSPAMFALFLEDLELFLQDRVNCGLSIFDLCVMLLCFADDMIIVGNSTEDLQKSLNRLHQYCNRWGLEVNTTKTKIVVFRKRGRTLINEKWFYNDSILEVVDFFNYLGVTFNYTGSFALNNQCMIGKALKAMNVLFHSVNKFELKPSTAMQLFDAFVASIINYACPIWGFTKSKDLERIHLRYSKMILGVRQNSCNDAVYGELGRYPLYINRYVQIVKYWLKLINTENIILKHVYQLAYEGCECGDHNWVRNVKVLLDDYGFSYIWRNPQNVHIKSFIMIFKQRVIDCFCQKWYTDVQSNNVLNTVYVNIKDSFGEEKYLDIGMCKRLRQCITKIRISSHNLRIQTGRFVSCVKVGRLKMSFISLLNVIDLTS